MEDEKIILYMSYSKYRSLIKRGRKLTAKMRRSKSKANLKRIRMSQNNVNRQKMGMAGLTLMHISETLNKMLKR